MPAFRATAGGRNKTHAFSATNGPHYLGPRLAAPDGDALPMERREIAPERRPPDEEIAPATPSQKLPACRCPCATHTCHGAAARAYSLVCCSTMRPRGVGAECVTYPAHSDQLGQWVSCQHSSVHVSYPTYTWHRAYSIHLMRRARTTCPAHTPTRAEESHSRRPRCWWPGARQTGRAHASLASILSGSRSPRRRRRGAASTPSA